MTKVTSSSVICEVILASIINSTSFNKILNLTLSSNVLLEM